MQQHAPILVVEDNENDALLIRRTLARSGIPHPLQFAENGEEAISYLLGMRPYGDRKKYPLPAMVLLDLKLRVMDGFQVLKWIRGHHLFGDLPVVVLTGSNKMRDVKKAYRLGANSFLVKPLEFENVKAFFATVGAQLWGRGNLGAIQRSARTSKADRESSESLPH